MYPQGHSANSGGTTSYAWFVWDKESTGKTVILNTTPKNVRMAEKRRLSGK